MNGNQKKRYEHITNPATIISFIVAVFGFWVTWATLNNRLNNLETFRESVDMIEIQTTLSSIQKDIERIKMALNNK